MKHLPTALPNPDLVYREGGKRRAWIEVPRARSRNLEGTIMWIDEKGNVVAVERQVGGFMHLDAHVSVWAFWALRKPLMIIYHYEKWSPFSERGEVEILVEKE